jgi:hypothetical protein
LQTDRALQQAVVQLRFEQRRQNSNVARRVEQPDQTSEGLGTCGVSLQPLVREERKGEAKRNAIRGAILAHGVLHADETLVAMLKPGTGKTHRAYLWAYTPGAIEDMKAVVYDFADSRAGQHAQDFLDEWRGALVCDDYSGYKAMLPRASSKLDAWHTPGAKFVELHTANKSQIAEAGIQYFAQLYEIEREVKNLGADERHRIRQSAGPADRRGTACLDDLAATKGPGRFRDITDDASVHAAVSTIEAASGRLDVLVSNAGIGSGLQSIPSQEDLSEMHATFNQLLRHGPRDASVPSAAAQV